MDRSNKFLKLIFVSVSMMTIVDCSNDKKNSEKENIYDLKPNRFSLSQSSGKYFFIPSINDNDYPNFKTFGLKKGDSIILEIKADSTFIFNHFYHDKLIRVDNYHGKIVKNLDELDKVFIPFPENSTNLQGFVQSKKDIYFYNHLNIENYSNYEYRLFLKKMK
ncbi:hypothetical protein J2795_002913 [Chryseobacterium bernardetii]|jgi:hypothetical protein|uniref:Uncharacterized protein n=2 Tax=Chryseobacterium TaxID=59732 RepID=A0A543EBW1_9FLAO|nr:MULTISPECIES: hypothetical protein [Chryseobacterium]MDR6371300.1 hypothetical protein [Chryseobacterium vietnamense]MDR6442195.1 hypothetical protein [Chryseobacterium bernardetii]TQM19073.1 hypothetical protein FB551_3468 [Chryseobacterium aquifrigidense]